jgi:hypothetical protein
MVSMTPKDTGLSFMITLLALAGLSGIGLWYRSQQPRQNKVPASPTPAIIAAEVDTPALAPEKAPQVEWDVLTECELVENSLNAADCFYVRRKGETYVFQLYFGFAPARGQQETEERAEEAKALNLKPIKDEGKRDKALANLGQLAWEESARWLSQRPFRVLTRWEQRPGSHHYYAFVYVDDEEKQRHCLQHLLARQGFLAYQPSNLKSLPDGSSADLFKTQLIENQSSAQQEQLGFWNPKNS